MKKIKYITFIILLIVGFFFNGELFMLHMENFQDAYFQCSFSFDRVDTRLSNEEILVDLKNTGNETDVDFFFVQRETDSLFSNSIKIFGTKGAVDALYDDGIKEGRYSSFFLGTLDVNVEPIDRITDIRTFKDCYFPCDETEIKNLEFFKSRLIDEYGGGFPKRMGSAKETYQNLLFVWGLIFSIITLITIYEVLYQKKENAIRIIVGENVRRLYLKNIIIDCFYYSTGFYCIPRLMESITHGTFMYSFITILFLFFLSINTFVHSFIFYYDFKRDLSVSWGRKSLSYTNYVLKFLSCILVAFLLAGNMIVVEKGINAYKQNDFFKEHENYYYYKMFYIPGENAMFDVEQEEQMNQVFFSRYQEHALQYEDLTNSYFEGVYPMVLVNKNAMSEIMKSSMELKEKEDVFKSDILYVLVPENIRDTSKEYHYLKEVASFIAEKRNLKLSFMQYKEKTTIVAIDNNINQSSSFYENPVLLYQQNGQVTENPYSIMYDLEEKEFKNFIKQYHLEGHFIAKTNVVESYNHQCEVLYRSMWISVVLSAFILILETWLIAFILRMEYLFNSIELALKKIHGYTLYQRNKTIIRLTVTCFLLSIFIVLGVNVKMNYGMGMELFFVEGVLAFIEIIYIFWSAKKLEKMKIVPVLKGER